MSPYIKQENRKGWNDLAKVVAGVTLSLPENEREGQLNYLITSILHKVYKPKYFEYNRAIGLLECIKQEYYRKIVAPYEELKIKENGDVE